MEPLRTIILVADRNRLVAEALVDAFHEIGDVDARIATSLAQALMLAQIAQPRLVLVDAWIARTRVEHVVAQLKECAPEARIIVMASRVDAEFERRVMQSGAAGCCVKEFVPRVAETMLQAVGSAS